MSNKTTEMNETTSEQDLRIVAQFLTSTDMDEKMERLFKEYWGEQIYSMMREKVYLEIQEEVQCFQSQPSYDTEEIHMKSPTL